MVTRGKHLETRRYCVFFIAPGFGDDQRAGGDPALGLQGGKGARHQPLAIGRVQKHQGAGRGSNGRRGHITSNHATGVFCLAASDIRTQGGKGGAIVNISSRSAFGPQVKNGPYGAAKAAVNSLTSTLSVELAPNIRVNAVAPGPVPTENFDECMGTDTDEKREKLLGMIGIPMGRYGTPEDIAAAVVFMASPAASWVTGQCLYVTGGR